MTFLWPLSLLFGLTALVPLALHLYQQQQRRVIEFSTDRFFTQSVVRAQRRLRLRQWILLLLRMMACLFVAFAAAQPIAHWFSPPGGHEGRRDVVILLDDSLSMAARSSSDQPTHFDQAKQTAQAILGQLSTGDRATIVRLSDMENRDSRLPPASSSSALDWESWSVSSKVADIDMGLKQAADLLAPSDAAAGRQPMVILLTDGQKANFPKTLRPHGLQPIPLLIQPIDAPTRNNTGVRRVDLNPPAPLVGQPVLVSARFFNHRSASVTGSWTLEQNGREVRRQPVTLPPQGEITSTCPVMFDQAQGHRLAVKLDIPDELPQDNLRQLDVSIAASMPVLLIDALSQHGRAGRQSPAFFIDAALSAATDQPSNPLGLKPQVISASQFDGTSLESYRAIILASWPALSEPQAERLAKYVRQGGGLAVFLGDMADADAVNRQLSLLLAATFTPPAIDDPAGPGPEKPLRIGQASTGLPMLQSIDESALAGWEIYRRWSVRSDQASCPIRLADGSPLLLQRSLGQGKVLIWTTSLMPSWSNLPMRKTFVPLMQNMVRLLAGPVERQNGLRSGGEKRSEALLSPPPSESSVAVIESADIDRLAESWQVSLLPGVNDDPMATAAQIQTAMNHLPQRGRLWDLLLWAVLAVLLIEPLLANWRRTSPANQNQETKR